MGYSGIFDKSVSGLRFIDRSEEGFLDVVYDLGLDGATPKLYDCGPYVLTVLKDGRPFNIYTRPSHFYGSSWWIGLVPVTAIIRDPKTLIADGLVPPFGDTGLPVGLPAPGSMTFPGPMGIPPGITGREANTGGRPDLGILSAWGAEYMMTGDPRNMLEVAKFVATQPIWNYDGGKLLNLISKPYITAYSGPQQGTEFWLGPWPAEPTDPNAPLQPSGPDTSHMLEVCGLAALATGSPRYVRGVQARLWRGFDEDNYAVGMTGGQVTALLNRQMRGTAWLLRELFYAYWATVLAEQAGNLPSDCQPSSVLKQIIDNQADQFTKLIEPSPIFQSLGVWALNNAQVAWWQCDMVNQVLGLYAGKWPDVWGAIYIKTLRNLMARVNGDGKKQWPVAYPTWYWANACSDPFPGSVPYKDYPTLWAAFSAAQVAGTEPSGNNGQLTAPQLATLTADPTNGGAYIAPSFGEYFAWLYGAIAYAVYLDRGVLAGAISAVYPNLEQAFSQQMAMMVKLGQLIAPCSIAINPKPIDTTPPEGELMPTTFTIAVGDTKQLNLVINGTLTDGPIYTTDNPAVVSLEPNAAGVIATGLSAGAAKITATGTGATELSAESDATVTLPLATTMDLVPAP